MHLYDLRDRGECTDAEVVESFLVRRMIVGVPTNNLNRIFSAIVQQLPTDRPISDGVRIVLQEFAGFGPPTSAFARRSRRNRSTSTVAKIRRCSCSSALKEPTAMRNQSIGIASYCRSSTSCRRP